MSDDYNDEDEPGGLWDPDAFTPPPARARPALHIVATRATANALDPPADATNGSEDIDQHTLVRLEQFRTASDRHVARRSPATSPTLRRAAAAGVLASVVAAMAVTYGTLPSPERSDLRTSTPRTAAAFAVDIEHAAATRKVASADSPVRQVRRPTSRRTHDSKNTRRPGNASQNHPPAHHTPTVAASRAPATSTPTTVARTATPTAHPQMPVASATAEFGFEG